MDCIYCGKPAGFLHRKHEECERQAIQRQNAIQRGEQEIRDKVRDALAHSDDFDELEKTISEIETLSNIPATERKPMLVEEWETCVKSLIDKGVIDEATEKRLVRFQSQFNLSDSDVDKDGVYTALVKAGVLRDVLNGTVPTRYSFQGDLPVNLQKGEQVAWGFCGTRYLEDRIHREYVGGSNGVSVRVMKGVYYHTSAFKGHTVENAETLEIDQGWAIMTNKNIYFAGPCKSLRLPYSKIVSFQPFSDGIGFMRDAATAKAQYLLTEDGWFTYNLVTNLAKL